MRGAIAFSVGKIKTGASERQVIQPLVCPMGRCAACELKYFAFDLHPDGAVILAQIRICCLTSFESVGFVPAGPRCPALAGAKEILLDMTCQ